jgi:two-component system, chemotaxis family, protein-glutamate methylesterase/glutaminase
MVSRKLNVLVVEDSRDTREMLVNLLRSDPELNVVDAVSDGKAALAAVEEYRPDVVTMDMHLPVMDGFEATRRIMETHPVPIVIISANSDAIDVAKSFRALEAGAVAAVERPADTNGYRGAIAENLLDTVKAMAGVKVVRRWPRARTAAYRVETPRIELPPKLTSDVQVVAIGASTGGPPVLRTILGGLGPSFPIPVLIVQHISSGFVQGLAEWLSVTTGMDVRLARHGEYAQPGHAYLAPDGCHMTVNRFGQIFCAPGQAENGLQPAVSCLFRSVRQHFGDRAVGVLLTGMGRDGADELKLMRDAGAVTIAQDKESSVIHGMPGQAIALDAARHVLPPERIVTQLRSLVCKAPAAAACH